jgi:hypothetical protein
VKRIKLNKLREVITKIWLIPWILLVCALLLPGCDSGPGLVHAPPNGASPPSIQTTPAIIQTPPTPTQTPEPTKSIQSIPTVATITSKATTPIPSVEILDHQVVHEHYLPPAIFSMTFVRGKVKNTGDITIPSVDVSIRVEYYILAPGGGVFTAEGGIAKDLPTFKPGEVRDFEVLLKNEDIGYYTVSIKVLNWES